MEDRYFNNYPGDDDGTRGRELAVIYAPPFSPKASANERWAVERQLIEQAWQSWYDGNFKVGPRYIATWFDRPMGFTMIKVKSPNSFLDRCAIENPDNRHSYALFDLWTYNGYIRGIPYRTFRVYDVKEYQISEDDAMLIRLAI